MWMWMSCRCRCARHERAAVDDECARAAWVLRCQEPLHLDVGRCGRGDALDAECVDGRIRALLAHADASAAATARRRVGGKVETDRVVARRRVAGVDAN